MDDIKKHYKVLSQIKNENEALLEINKAINGKKYDEKYNDVVQPFFQLDKSIGKEIQTNGSEQYMEWFLQFQGKNPKDYEKFIKQLSKERNTLNRLQRTGNQIIWCFKV